MKAAQIVICASLMAWPCFVAADTFAQRRALCLGWMLAGYPSGLEESACMAQFSLPSPFLFKCVRGRKTGFDTDLQRQACSDYLARASLEAAESYVRQN